MADLLARQQDELESLKSIYNDILTDVTPHGKVWNRNACPHFQIALESQVNPARPVVSLVLDIEFTPTYPRLSPVVRVLHPKNLLRARLAAIDAKISHSLAEYIGEEVCFTIIMDVKELLDDFQEKTEQVLSLEEERLKRIENERRVLEQKEQEAAKIELLAKARKLREADEQLSQMNLDFSAEALPLLDLPLLDLVPSPLPANCFVFDNTLLARVPLSNTRLPFRVIHDFTAYNSHDILLRCSSQFLVKPYFPPSIQARLDEKSAAISYVLYVVTLDDPHWQSSSGKQEVRNLELELEACMAIHSDSVLKISGYQIDLSASGQWTIRILTEFSMGQQSLTLILEAAQFVNWSLARSWLIQLLPSLEALHASGLTHRFICPWSAMLCEVDSENGSNPAKILRLCHPTYGLSLLRMCNYPLTVDRVFAAEFFPDSWEDPDTMASPVKTDIWQLGVLFMRIMLKFDILETEFKTPDGFLTKFDVRNFPGVEKYAGRVYDLLSKMVQPKLLRRSTLLELNAAEFFRAGVEPSVGKETPNTSEITSTLTKNASTRPIDSSKYQKSVLDARRNVHPNQDSTHDKFKVMQRSAPLPRTESSTGYLANQSRYSREFEEVGKLGKGGFGEVVKARNKMEGTFYAIKKIKHRQDKLESLLSEVFSLARLNHQFIVRYYGCWVEEIPAAENHFSDDESNDETSESSLSDIDDFEGPLNVRSSSFLSHDNSFQIDYITNSVTLLDYDSDYDDGIVFANSSDEETHLAAENTEEAENTEAETSSDESEEESSVELPKKSPGKAILYIQMEFCENNTLLDLIERGLPDNPSGYWRLFRQMLEAVSYIHSSGFIHRDLKPTNIFIDKSNNVKVGDFGLAKNSQFSSALTKNNQVAPGNSELSTVVGTFFYTAKEVATGLYDEKVDMYSLGIIFFEMCYSMGTGMERAETLNRLRLYEIIFPSNFPDSKKATEKKLIRQLLDHDPKRRPSAARLLQSGMIPVEHQDVIIKEALKSLADPSSPWQQQVRDSLFNQPYLLARDIMFDRVGKSSHSGILEHNTHDYFILARVLDEVTKIFRAHGAIQDFCGSNLIPKSQFQLKDHVYELLDRSGSVLTLTYDLVLPTARFLSRRVVNVSKSFTHEFVYRPSVGGIGKPEKYNAVSFDVMALHPEKLIPDSAECIKTADEILNALPCFQIKNAQSYIVINHMDILNSVIDFALGTSQKLSQTRRYELMGLLSQLGVERGAEEIKSFMRNDFKIQHTVVKDLVDVFNFTVDPAKAEQKLRKIMVDSPLLAKVEKAMCQLREILVLSRKLGVSTTISFCPLSNYNARYYEGSFMFQVIYRPDRNRKFSRVATGGRYDNLIEYLSSAGLTLLRTPHAVGFQLTITLLFTLMKNIKWMSLLPSSRSKDFSAWKTTRCDVLLVSLDKHIIEDGGFELLNEIWSQGISCDWYVSASHEDMMEKAYSDGINWLVQLKQPILKSRRSRKGLFKPLRVKNLNLNKEQDVDYDEILGHLTHELAERDQEMQHQTSAPAETREQTVNALIGEPLFNIDLDQRVVVVPNLAKGRKNNRRDKWELENDSKLAAASMMKSLSKAPILTVDSDDAVLDMISSTSLDVPQEEWLKRAYSAYNKLPRNFGVSIYETLKKEAERGTKWAVLHAPRTDKTAVVDLQR